MSTRQQPLAPRGAPGGGAATRHDELARSLGWFSIGLGFLELTAARGLCRALGLRGRETLIQAYGIREVATGVAILTSHDPTPWILGRVGGDVIDLATLATGFEDDNPKKTNLAAATAAVAGVTVLDVICAQGLIGQKRLSPPGAFDYSTRSGFPRPARTMRGAASDFEPPADFRIPEPLRSWQPDRM
ncbi:cyclase dehydrase [Methylobacterium sp. J-001]|uniref:cyclase dehydrase n=1 Tax=Methylobacterium sp. J-001 TaxID=2836609 RepID=UPI001FBBED30|nr:cyclase dehydrase [Methylobacterium sp. J-001]MCJ2120833.1 cyclase dehydrase [Methylobacterium sp. J-001]